MFKFNHDKTFLSVLKVCKYVCIILLLMLLLFGYDENV